MALKPVQAFKCPQGHTEDNPTRAMAFSIVAVLRDKNLGELVTLSAALKLLEKRAEVRAMFDELDRFLNTGLIEPELETIPVSEVGKGVLPKGVSRDATIKNGGIGAEEQQAAERNAELDRIYGGRVIPPVEKPPVDAIGTKQVPLFTGVDRRVPRMDGSDEF